VFNHCNYLTLSTGSGPVYPKQRTVLPHVWGNIVLLKHVFNLLQLTFG